MRRIGTVAWREFRHTALTKAFIIGAVVLPLVMFAVIPLVPMLTKSTPKPLTGRVVVIDPQGGVAAAFETALLSKEPAAPRDREDPFGGTVDVQVKVERIADPGRETELRKEVGDGALAALVVVARDDKGEKAEVLVPSASSPKHTRRLESAAREAVVRARVAGAGENYDRLRELMRSERVDTSRISPKGDAARESTELRMLVPAGFMFLLWIAVFTSANYLLTSTIEEKSNRVMEVLLSAVSPMELLCGKLVGQAAVSTVMLAMYGGVALSGLGAVAMLDVVPPSHIVWLVVWFPIAYFMVAAIMASVGSAVSDLREAQSLVGPAMLALMVPLMLWLPIVENPNGPLAVAFSFIPPASPFVNVLRLTAANEPVPLLQSILAVLVGIASVAALLWAGARIFRVGVLMQGKTPTPRELLRWIWMR
ncbi:MAG: ABC transporter permease [Planctomycetes bacterium]|nr:ABC transporter permease [Planctomycetota bacterium]